MLTPALTHLSICAFQNPVRANDGNPAWPRPALNIDIEGFQGRAHSCCLLLACTGHAGLLCTGGLNGTDMAKMPRCSQQDTSSQSWCLSFLKNPHSLEQLTTRLISILLCRSYKKPEFWYLPCIGPWYQSATSFCLRELLVRSSDKPKGRRSHMRT